MEVFLGHRTLPAPPRAAAVALGNFDGFHRGHQALVGRAVEAARARGGAACVFTFDPHPAKILAPELAPRLLTTRARKLELLDVAGIDVCVLEPFNLDIAGFSPDAFFDQVLQGAFGAVSLHVGYDFTFGKKRAGNTNILTELATPRGVTVDILEPVAIDGLVASSTRVRSFVTDGNLPGARLLLGRDFEVDGTVVRGAQRGRTLGFPTANIEPATELLPKPGIYAVRLLYRGARYGGAASLGTNPTFGDNAQTLEVFVFDFDGDLYDQPVRVEFVERLRGEERFDSESALVAQMNKDVAAARQILKETPHV